MNDSIFRPNYTITPGTEVALSDLERQKWLIENMLLMPKHEAWITRDVRIRRATGTTRIEGATLDEEAVRGLERSGPTGRHTEEEHENLNALQAYDFIDFLSDQHDITLDELVIRQLNRDFMKGFSDTLTPGSYRRGESKVGMFTPPNQGDVPSLMRSFASWLREDQELHPVIKTGLAHIHLIAIRPFWDGNGRTARGLSTLILQRSPFGFRKLLSLETALFHVRDEYFAAIERTLGKSFEPGYDGTPWLEFFVQLMGLEVGRLRAVLTEWHRWMEEAHEIMEEEGVPPRLADGLAFAKQTGSMTRGDYMEIAGVSPMTASRDLAQLVDFGLLVPQGKTRSRVYYPTVEAAEPSRQVGGEQLPLPQESVS